MKRQNKRISVWVLFILAFVCLTPILGGIVGSIITLLGIFVYKNISLIIIGAIGIAVTTTSYLYLHYYSNHRGPFDEGRIIESKKEMNNLIKDIELYKMSYGKYPVDLTSLKNNNLNIKITDPVQAINRDKEPYYFYKVVNQKYYLFSKGFDGIPFTKDDILPSMKGINPFKIGIILTDSASN